MFPIIGTLHLIISTECPKEKAHVIIVVDNNTLQIARTLLTRPKLRRPGRSVQFVGVVVEAEVGAVADAKVTAKSVSKIRGMGTETIM